MSRNNSLENLHPIMRAKINVLDTNLTLKKSPMRLFEGFRTPQRQHSLYSQGRTKPGAKVTNANAWSSYHQYGVACDYVLFIDGKWSWNDSGKYKKYWTDLHLMAQDVGLVPISWEKPHLQLAGLGLQTLLAGEYPDGGDDSWAENLQDAIYSWPMGAPPPPLSSQFERPALPNNIIDEQTTHPLYRVTARNGLRMRSGPGTNFDIVTTLTSHQIVQVTQKVGDWCQIDVEGDGLADGYCHSGFLVLNS
ncbi:M15 family metallopeptidase [uncultured Paraglaciecola sp.]|uniref:M15 family metallopeptidase n=1 Tax=uncultured Paraglaciecola sp. TaxID=1765024 RepID=UPI002598B378|nr:M15 family metallopeptidase [uncultured Paraglaciecola sp.]